jgi:uncharacterized protein (TIGR00369 family)
MNDLSKPIADGRVSAEAMQAMADSCPFNAWLGLRVLAVGFGTVTLSARWRDEMMGAQGRKLVHGGVLAALMDATAGYAIAAAMGHASPTVDLRTDYHRIGRQADFLLEGAVIRAGRTIGTAEARIFDADRHLVASGRATFLTAQTTLHEDRASRTTSPEQ